MNIKNASYITTLRDFGDVCPVFRCVFAAKKAVRCAELEITALGVYEARLNGTRVGQFVLAPGWTSYDKRLQVQRYDITDLIKTENELQVTVGRGWFRSPMPGWEDSEDKQRRYTRPCGLIAILHLTYADGSEEHLSTDEKWACGESAVRFSEIYDGETFDACFETAAWEPVTLLDWSKEILIPQEGEEIREIEAQFAAAAVRAVRAGYDGGEIHCAHSYLLNQFYSPMTNKRTDAYGGSLEKRLRITLEAVEQARRAIVSSSNSFASSAGPA